MAGKTRKQIFVKGLGNMQILQIDPTPDLYFTHVGWLESTKITDKYDMEKVVDEQGNVVEYLAKAQECSFETQVLQTAKTQLDILRNAKLQQHAARYYGLTSPDYFQYFCFPKVRLDPTITQDYKIGLRKLPMKGMVQFEGESTITLPVYYLNESRGPMYMDFVALWIDPAMALNKALVNVLDISGFELHGTMNSDFATIWQGNGAGTPAYFLRFDGVNDQISFGDVADIDSDDFAVEMWVRVMAADGTLQEIASKKADDVNTAGWRIVRTTGNKIAFKLSDGTNSATETGSANVLTNVWTKISVQVKRGGNAQIFVNGVADGAPVSVAAVTATADNATNLLVAAFAGGFGQVDVGDFRIHNYNVGGQPSNFATIELNHYNAEKASYGF